MRLTRNSIRSIVERALREDSGAESYRCFDGREVPFGSDECLLDIEARIDDAIRTRDTCRCRTDKRVAYNSLLQMLRREKREAVKENQRLYADIS